jgi:glycosyltransferase involved in cell wall biosynthesis
MVYDLARQLARRGHQVTVCTTDALDRGTRLPKGEVEMEGVRVVRFPNWSNALAFHLKIFLPRGMRRWLDAHVRDFDVVHLFDARTMLNAWAADAAARAGVPFLLSVWGSLPRGDGWRALIKGRYDRRHGPTQLGRAAALLAQNEHEGQLYLDYGGVKDQVKLWPLGVDPAEVSPLPMRGAFRAQHGLGDAPLVLFVGRLHELKGLDPLFRAFARGAPADARLVIVGRDDGYLARARSLATELGIAARVTLTGGVYGKDVLPAYVDCDLFAITPTHFEETSLASLTACAVGRPILINDRCGIPWLKEFDAGVCVPHSVEGIAAQLKELLTDGARLRTMGENARRMVEERFTTARIIDQLEGHYREAVVRSAAA